MATTNWIGNAHATRQIDTVTFANTWAGNDTVTATINTKDLIVTVGTGTTTAQVAATFAEAWNAASRVDGTGSTTNTSNFGAQEFGEFAGTYAEILSTSLSVVRIIARTPGVPFTLSVTENTAGDGTATEAPEQVATGPNFWDNGDNWSGGAAPSSDDTTVFKDTNISVKYGLPNGSLEVTMVTFQSFTGQIGLYPINTDIPSKPYYEYRQRYVRLDDAGGGSDIAHRFGMGEGTGSPLINVKHSTVKISPIVYNTGTPQVAGVKALNICATTNTSTINILNGHVDFSTQDGSTSAFVTVKQSGGNTRSDSGIHTTGAVVTISGGRAVIGGGALATVHARGGVLRIEGQTGTITALNVLPTAIVEYASIATITTLVVKEGTFDARPDAGPFTVTNFTLYPGSVFDPYDRITATNGIMHYGELGPNFLLSGSNNNPVVITPP